MTNRSERVGCFTRIEPTILDSRTTYVHVTHDVTDLIHILANRVSVTHAGRCEQLSV
jgi:ABC-type proline/glycine betaine transport system ATPase subunit